MCNLGEGIEERATERATKVATEQIILNMHKKGYSLEQIADVMEKSIEAVKAIIEKEMMTV